MIIYNLFPRVAGKITEWSEKLNSIKDMGFTHIYVNPIFEVGYSKSLYAPKNFKKIDPVFIDQFSEYDEKEQLEQFITNAHNLGLKVIFEMIFTHTAIDSELLIEHPDWYKYENGNLKKFSFEEDERWQEWGDLIEFDNDNSKDRDGLWNYWQEILNLYIDAGADGFKCEAAYKVPEEMWKVLIKNSKLKKENIIFIADNLGAFFYEMVDLANAGFDFLFTSFKWWDFKSTWFLEQHYNLKNMVKLISFPESFETGRLAKQYDLNKSASMSWYGMSALLNTGAMIPIGYEYGCVNKLDVIDSYEDDIADKNIDITDYIKKINSIKINHKLFREETDLYFINGSNQNVFIFKKATSDKSQEAVIIANKNYEESERVYFGDITCLFEKKNIKDISPYRQEKKVVKEFNCILEPGEIKVLYAED